MSSAGLPNTRYSCVSSDRSDTGESMDRSTVWIPVCIIFSFSGEYIRSCLLGFNPKGVRVLSSIINQTQCSRAVLKRLSVIIGQVIIFLKIFETPLLPNQKS